jgi:hypothetical protein
MMASMAENVLQRAPLGWTLIHRLERVAPDLYTTEVLASSQEVSLETME